MSEASERVKEKPIASPVPTLVEAGVLPSQSAVDAIADPTADGILMAHQLAWIEDQSPLKIAEKCRRSGFTFAEALDDTITAATKRSEGGDNVFYIGDTQEKGREFINYCASFATKIAGWKGAVEEFLFKDQKEDGTTRDIAAFRITFASGHRIAALSSRPENIRGLQGIVVIDEAAFHKDVGEVIDAAVALLIWGGRIRIISTHNGRLNPFNELVTRTRAGKTNYSLHGVAFDEVIENGLYDRVKAMNPKIAPFEEWYQTIRDGYVDENRMREELDKIPRDAEGAALQRVQVEACLDKAMPVLRLSRPDAFKLAPEGAREREIEDWIRKELAPVMAQIDLNSRTLIGGDIARKGHATCVWVSQIGLGLKREGVAVVELRGLPFAQQRQILFYIIEHAGRRWRASIDASGLGMEMAETARLKYGANVAEVTFSNAWYAENGAKLVTSVTEKSVTVPADDDVISDICALSWIGGVVKIPEGHETTGKDGGKRHADAAIALMLTEDAASEEPVDMDGVRTDGSAAAPEADGWAGQLERPQAGFGAPEVGGGWGAATDGVDFSGWGTG